MTLRTLSRRGETDLDLDERFARSLSRHGISIVSLILFVYWFNFWAFELYGFGNNS